MVQPRLILIGFDRHVLESTAARAAWPNCEVVRVPDCRAAAQNVGGDRDTVVAVAVADAGDKGGAHGLAQLARAVPKIRTILAVAQVTDSDRKALGSGQVNAIAPMNDETLLAAAIRDALERIVLEASSLGAAARVSQLESELADMRSGIKGAQAQHDERLELKIRELEGRNDIAQHLMRVHTMDATLAEVLRVLAKTLHLERAVVHLSAGTHLHPSAAIRIHDHGKVPEVYDPGEVESAAVVRQAIEKARDTRQSQNVTDPQTPFVSPFAAVPILRDTEVLGVIEVENYRSQRVITDPEIEAITNLAIEVSVAIQDVHYHENFERWKHQLSRIVTEVEQADPYRATTSG